MLIFTEKHTIAQCADTTWLITKLSNREERLNKSGDKGVCNQNLASPLPTTLIPSLPTIPHHDFTLKLEVWIIRKRFFENLIGAPVRNPVRLKSSWAVPTISASLCRAYLTSAKSHVETHSYQGVVSLSERTDLRPDNVPREFQEELSPSTVFHPYGTPSSQRNRLDTNCHRALSRRRVEHPPKPWQLSVLHHAPATGTR